VLDGVVLGVDTHLDFHVAVALDRVGRRLGEVRVPTTAEGYERVVRWAEGFGPVRCAGIEGTGSYGAGLARHLKAAGIAVVEVERPKRRHLRRRGKSDPIDAEAAARTVLAGEAAGVPRSGDGRAAMIRAFRSARQSAVKARSQAANQLQSFVLTAPEGLRHCLRGLSTKELVAAAAPELTSLPAIGTHHAATLLLLAGDNPERLKSEASFASLCGVSPVEASSGKVVRHRLNRGGNRDANRALCT
jgi:transposase